jgi:hypothetical protein
LCFKINSLRAWLVTCTGSVLDSESCILYPYEAYTTYRPAPWRIPTIIMLMHDEGIFTSIFAMLMMRLYRRTIKFDLIWFDLIWLIDWLIDWLIESFFCNLRSCKLCYSRPIFNVKTSVSTKLTLINKNLTLLRDFSALIPPLYLK